MQPAGITKFCSQPNVSNESVYVELVAVYTQGYTGFDTTSKLVCFIQCKRAITSPSGGSRPNKGKGLANLGSDGVLL